MADKAKNKSAENEAGLTARRKALAEKLSKKTAQAAPAMPFMGKQSRGDSGQSALAMGFRLSADFLSAILVGGVLGLIVDKLAGISPWGLLVLLLLGFAAGVMNILRSLGRSTPFEKRKQP
ncbi:AtpZ/AtpI family protein [Candidatus Tokpelaia sp.]|uniref:AtpZ/AtpI family protein n=1 Tax=Candidatus Tokpelaia sp. TaxID=2233777 RepID=UPI001FEEBF8D|nr:AtpZ/AtpI family protein [Candidatus Tokpelaia sp.]